MLFIKFKDDNSLLKSDGQWNLYTYVDIEIAKKTKMEARPNGDTKSPKV